MTPRPPDPKHISMFNPPAGRLCSYGLRKQMHCYPRRSAETQNGTAPGPASGAAELGSQGRESEPTQEALWRPPRWEQSA